jgi:hypothetical protein
LGGALTDALDCCDRGQRLQLVEGTVRSATAERGAISTRTTHGMRAFGRRHSLVAADARVAALTSMPSDFAGAGATLSIVHRNLRENGGDAAHRPRKQVAAQA